MADGGDGSTPPSFFCPITYEIMHDPVFTADGETRPPEVSRARVHVVPHEDICALLLHANSRSY
jgi:hypothetical protein